jgi:Domain of unknown function (DUF4386)
MAEASPRVKARIAGACWLMTIVAGMVAMFAGGQAGTAANLLATAFYLGATVFVYQLLKPVNKSLSLLAALFSLVGCVISILRPFDLAPPGVNPLVFFGLHCLLVGYLIFRSTFLPRILGALLAFGGVGWLTFLSPPLAESLSPYVILPGLLGEGALSLWLLTVGVDVPRWKERAGGRLDPLPGTSAP